MSQDFCPRCGSPMEPDVTKCKFCGKEFAPYQILYTKIDSTWPKKNKTAAGCLALLLGGFGVHHFYLGNIGMGIFYLCFCWTGIPAFVGLIDGIRYLCSTDEDFQLKNHVRIK